MKVRALVAVVLLAFAVMGWKTVFSVFGENEAKYNSYLQNARNNRKNEVAEEAIRAYKQVLELEDSLEIRKELIDYYKELGRLADYKNGFDQIIDIYPKEVVGYECACQFYSEREDYEQFYSYYKKMTKRGLKSDAVQVLYEENKYASKLEGDALYDMKPYAGNLAMVKANDGMIGYVNTKGSTKISPKYSNGSAFNGDGYALVCEDITGEVYLIDKSAKKKCAALNKNNEVVTPVTDMTIYSQGYVAICMNDNYFFINIKLSQKTENGGVTETIITPNENKYSFAGPFNLSRAAVITDKGWQFINTSFKTVSDNVYEDIKLDEKNIAYRNDVAFVKENGLYYMIDVNGTKVSNEGYEDAVVFFESNGLAAVKKNGKWGFVNNKGEMKIEPQFEEARSFMSGFAAVKVDGKWGFANTAGTVVIESEYDMAYEINSNGRIPVKVGDRWRLLKIYSIEYK